MKRNLIYHAHIPFRNQATVKALNRIALITELEVIAKDGATLVCNRQTLDQLLPNTTIVAPKQPAAIEVVFTLDDHTIEAWCNVIAVRRLARDAFQIVLRFKDISEQHLNSIDHYINDTMKNNIEAHPLLSTSRSSTSELSALGKVA